MTGALAAMAAVSAPAWLDVDAAGALIGGATSVLNLVAHEDDDLIFLNPDILDHIQSGRYVRTVYLTAGDGGSGSSYWLGREAGTRAGYESLVGVSGWDVGDAGIAGHPIPLLTSQSNPRLSLAYLRLPDGRSDGSGFSSHGYQSLQSLYDGSIGSISAIDGSSSYTRAGLLATLVALMAQVQADVINTQDFAGGFGDGDHSDHHAAAFLVREAHTAYAATHQLNGYLGYPSQSRPQNVSGAKLTTKQNAFFAYVAYDTSACGSPNSCAAGSYGQWLKRQYVTDSVGVEPPANQPPTASISSPASSATWAVGQAIVFAGSGNDREDGTLPAGRLEWRVELVSPGAGTRGSDLLGPGQSYSGVAGGTFTVPAWNATDQLLQIVLTATDSSGDSDTTTLRLSPRRSTIVAASSPPGLTVAIGGQTAVAPVQLTVIEGAALTVSVATTQQLGAVPYTFEHWSDGGAATHTVTAPGGGTTLTATFLPPAPQPAPPPTPEPVPTVPAAGPSTLPPATPTVDDPNLLAYFRALRQQEITRFLEALDRLLKSRAKVKVKAKTVTRKATTRKVATRKAAKQVAKVAKSGK